MIAASSALAEGESLAEKVRTGDREEPEDDSWDEERGP